MLNTPARWNFSGLLIFMDLTFKVDCPWVKDTHVSFCRDPNLHPVHLDMDLKKQSFSWYAGLADSPSSTSHVGFVSTYSVLCMHFVGEDV